MNKKEVSEIKKTLKPEDSTIDLIRTCYVSGDKLIVGSHKSSFVSLNEGERQKYIDLLRKAMGGKLNHTLIELEFQDEEEKDGGKQNTLYKMIKNSLSNDAEAESLYKDIISTYEHTGNYLILLAHGSYGIPSIASDGAILGESEYTYSFIICCLCPVELSKSGLCYSDPAKTFVNTERDWLAGNPEVAFTFPAFTDRQMDIHHTLYYAKKASEPHIEIEEGILGCTPPIAANDQKEAFKEVIQETLGDEANVGNIVNLNREINAYVKDMENNEEIPIMSGDDVDNLLSRSGINRSVETEKIQVMADVVAEEKYVFEAEGMKLQVDKEYIDYIQQTAVDGRPCLLLPLNGITLNGIKLVPKKK